MADDESLDEQLPEWKLDISLKQREIIETCKVRDGMRKFIFVNGCKWSGKTLGCIEAVIDHIWNVDGARVCIIAASIGAGDDSGVWTELIKHIEAHVAGDYGLDWWQDEGKRKICGARQKGASKKIYCEIKNKNGKKSYLELNSLKDEREVEKYFFNRYFSFIYWSELQTYKQRKSFDTLIQSLRIAEIAEEDHVLLCDGNPSDEGKRAWQYHLFFEFRVSDEVSEDEKPLQKNLKLIIINLNDNPYLSDERKREIAASYMHNPDLYSRYVLGEWTASSEGAHFADVFLPNEHLVGDVKELDPEILVPTDGCSELISGWDTGGKNPFAYIAEKLIFHIIEKDKDGKDVDKAIAAFRFLDELAFLDEDISPEEFTELFMEKMAFWQGMVHGEIRWQHWADNSALDFKESIAQRSVADEVFQVSEGTIKLEGFSKGKGSVGHRLRLWRKLLIQKRIVISAPKCPKLVEMNQMLKKGRTEGSIPKHSPYKHPFDAATYLVGSECWEELQNSILTIRTSAKESQAESKLVTVPM
jgi:hypothetical protein